MKIVTYGLLLLAATLTACAYNVAPNDALPEAPLNWLVGCWQTDSGVEETWIRSQQGDQLFGYSVTAREGQQIFFEQLRIDISGERATLFAYPKGVGPTPFKATLDDPFDVEFVNAGNDYPQRIRYTLVDGRVKATIALMDNTSQNEWRYVRCE